MGNIVEQLMEELDNAIAGFQVTRKLTDKK